LKPLLPLLLAALVCASCREERSARTGVLEAPATPSHALNPLPDPELEGGHVGKAPRRISVSQLAASIEVTTGQKWKQLDQLAPSLGKADYALVTQETYEPTMVFAKFLDDGAREVCLLAAKADLAATSSEARVLSRDVKDQVATPTSIPAEAVRQNIQTLSVRFWGSPLRGAELDDWAQLFSRLATQGEAAKKPEHAWAALCIAFLTDPRFFTY
jgi:hypothetical protein